MKFLNAKAKHYCQIIAHEQDANVCRRNTHAFAVFLLYSSCLCDVMDDSPRTLITVTSLNFTWRSSLAMIESLGIYCPNAFFFGHFVGTARSYKLSRFFF